LYCKLEVIRHSPFNGDPAQRDRATAELEERSMIRQSIFNGLLRFNFPD